MKLIDTEDDDIYSIAEKWIWSGQANRVDIEEKDKISGETYYISLIKFNSCTC